MTLGENDVQLISGGLALLVAVILPVGINVGFMSLSIRHLEGRRSRYDSALSGAASAGLIGSHLEAGTRTATTSRCPRQLPRRIDRD